MNEFRYIGSELELFAAAHNWKSYWSSRILPFIAGDVLEVGAGIGANTAYLNRGEHRSWVCLEPDASLSTLLASNLQTSNHLGECGVVCGTLQSVKERRFDTIMYIDVLEHIANDRDELQQAAALLRGGGHLIVLSPAHQSLFSPFDAAIGHFRRYSRAMLRDLSAPSLRLDKLWYLDSAGLVLSLVNRLFLRQSLPTKAQLRFWDEYVIPVSRVLDRCLFGSVGKSLVGIWRRETD